MPIWTLVALPTFPVTKVMDTRNLAEKGHRQEARHSPGVESNSLYRNRRRQFDDSTVDAVELTDGESADFDVERGGEGEALSLMEEMALLALDEDKGSMSLLNDNVSYVLRCCVLLELAMQGRLKVNLYSGGSRDEPWKLPVVISDFTPTGDCFLDETMRIIQRESLSLERWVDVLTGETWSRRLSVYQLLNLRDRLCKSLLERGIVTAQKSKLFMMETTSYSLLDFDCKRSLCFDIIDTGMGAVPLTLRALCRLLSLSAARILNRALRETDAPTRSRVKAQTAELSQHYTQLPHLEAKFGHLSDGQLCLIAGIFAMYTKMNNLF